MPDLSPLDCLNDLVARIGPFDRLGVAVSGGSDSLAALILAIDALGAGSVAAVTVDHGLRPEAAEEAQRVADLCKTLGVEHQILHWGGPSGGNLQDEARQARLALIGGWARGRVDAVLVAHTQDDQAETLLMRLARGSGVDGLSGMTEMRRSDGVMWLRPFLNVPRTSLRRVLSERGVSWVEDPSNADDRFQRVRARTALAALAPLGIDAPGLAATAARLQRARAALDAQTAEAMRDVLSEDAGTAVLSKSVLGLAPEIRDRVFAHLLIAMSGASYRPRLDGLHRLIGDMGTLMGCVLVDEGAHLRLYREARAVEELVASSDELWDGRWRAEGPGRGVIRAMGDDGLRQLSTQAKAGLHPHWRGTGLSAGILSACPAIWRNGQIIAAPLAFWPQKWHLFARPLAAIGDRLELSH